MVETFDSTIRCCSQDHLMQNQVKTKTKTKTKQKNQSVIEYI